MVNQNGLRDRPDHRVAIRCHNRCQFRTAHEPQTGNGGQDAGAQSIESSRYFGSANRQDRNGIVEVRGSIPLSSTRYENPGSDAGVFLLDEFGACGGGLSRPAAATFFWVIGTGTSDMRPRLVERDANLAQAMELKDHEIARMDFDRRNARARDDDVTGLESVAALRSILSQP